MRLRPLQRITCARRRFHIGYDEEKTLTGLVDDWDRYQRANIRQIQRGAGAHTGRGEGTVASDAGTPVRFALPDGERADADRVTVIVSRGTEDDRTTSPLEIVRGDRLRIGATHWEKQLFNGTVVTVEDFKVQRGEAGTEPSVLISAHTEDGREPSSFRHDEIRDWYGNIRLDHGYALTITSAQGLTVDRTFLLADARPAREKRSIRRLRAIAKHWIYMSTGRRSPSISPTGGRTTTGKRR